MSLLLSDIERIAHLARLELQPQQSERLLTQINAFFEVVEQIRSIPAQHLQPLAHPLAAIEEVSLRLNEDRVSESDQRTANQQNAPSVEAGLFLVPKVIE